MRGCYSNRDMEPTYGVGNVTDYLVWRSNPSLFLNLILNWVRVPSRVLQRCCPRAPGTCRGRCMAERLVLAESRVAIFRSNYGVNATKKATDSTTHALLNSAGARVWHHCTPGLVREPESVTNRDNRVHCCAMYSRWRSHASMSVTCYALSNNIHAYVSVVKPKICPDGSIRLKAVANSSVAEEVNDAISRLYYLSGNVHLKPR